MGATDFTDEDEIAQETSDPVCGGISISENTFTGNIGCAQVSGIASIQCLKPAGWAYSDELSIYSFPQTTEMTGVSATSSATLTVDSYSTS